MHTNFLKKYKPMVISVEYNCHFPHDKAITFPNNPNFSWEGDRSYGASLKALKLVGEKNGYSLLWVVKYLDAFFIRNDLIEDGSDSICFPYEKWINHCNILGHKRSIENKLLNEFIDYEVYLESNYNLEESKKAAKNVTKEYLISNPLSFREIKYALYSSLDFINDIPRIIEKIIRIGKV